MSGSSRRWLRLSALLVLVWAFLLSGTVRSAEWTTSAWLDSEQTVGSFKAATVPSAVIVSCDAPASVLNVFRRVTIRFVLPADYGLEDTTWVLRSGVTTSVIENPPQATTVGNGTYSIEFSRTLLESLLGDLLGTVIDLLLGARFQIGLQVQHDHESWASTIQFSEVWVASLGLSASCTPLN